MITICYTFVVSTQHPQAKRNRSWGIKFTTEIATCEHGNKDNGEDHPGVGQGKWDKSEDHPGQGHGNGHQDEADEADETEGNGHGRPASPGKSKKPPGRRDK